MPQIIPFVLLYCMDVNVRTIQFHSVQYRSAETETLSVILLTEVKKERPSAPNRRPL